MQKVIHYHNFFKYITSFTYVFWDSALNCTIQNVYQVLKQATDTPGGSRRVWEFSRVGMCVACLPPLPSRLFPFSWELVAPQSSSIIWAEASVLTDARTCCMWGSNLYAVVFIDYSSQVWGGGCFFPGLLLWESCVLTESKTVMSPWRSVGKVSLSPWGWDLEKKLRFELHACLAGHRLPEFCPHPITFQKSHTKILKWFCKVYPAWVIWHTILVAQDDPWFLPHLSWRENAVPKAFIVQSRKMLTPV